MAVGSEARSTFLAVVKGDASQAVAEFKKLGGSVEKATSNANTSMGKFRSVTSKAFSELNNNAGMFAAGAGAALGAFAVKAVNDFSKLGVEVGRFADATGLSAEESSRWAEVSGDLGIELGAVETSLNKLNRSIDPKKFAEYGIAIAKTKDGATDVNGTFLNVIDRLNGIQDPAERAKVATALLGRNWMALSEIIGKGSGAIRSALAGVSNAKVLSADEIDKARRYRDAMDNLKDALEEVTLTAGEKLAPAFVKGANALVTTLGWIGDGLSFVAGTDDDYAAAMSHMGKATLFASTSTKSAAAGIKDYLKAINDGIPTLGKAGVEIGDLLRGSTGGDDHWKAGQILKKGFEELVIASKQDGQAFINQLERIYVAAAGGDKDAQAFVDKWNLTAETIGYMQGRLEYLHPTVRKATNAMTEYGDANKVAAQKAAESRDRVDELNRQMDIQRGRVADAALAWETFMGAIDNERAVRDLSGAIGEAAKELKKTKDLAPETRDNLIDMFNRTIGAGNLLAANNFKIAIDNKDLLTAQKLINDINQKLALHGTTLSGGMTVSADIRNAMEDRGKKAPGKAIGGPVSAGKTYLVGERGPELFTPGSSGGITPNSSLMSLSRGGPVINVTVTPFASPTDVGRAVNDVLAAYYRSGGARA